MDEILFDIGKEAEVFYIIRSGRVVVETVIEIEDYNKYPIVSSFKILVHPYFL